MSGWNLMDKSMEENTGDSFPAQNNITIAGYLPSDQVPQSGESPLYTNSDIQQGRAPSSRRTSRVYVSSESGVDICPLSSACTGTGDTPTPKCPSYSWHATGESMARRATSWPSTTSYPKATSDSTTFSSRTSGVASSSIRLHLKAWAVYRETRDTRTTRRSNTKTKAASCKAFTREATGLRSDSFKAVFKASSSNLPCFAHHCISLNHHYDL